MRVYYSKGNLSCALLFASSSSSSVAAGPKQLSAIGICGWPPRRSLLHPILRFSIRCCSSSSSSLIGSSDRKMGSQTAELDWPAKKVRDSFIDFFVDKKGHVNWTSSPVVPLNDPTLLFANAGSTSPPPPSSPSPYTYIYTHTTTLTYASVYLLLLLLILYLVIVIVENGLAQTINLTMKNYRTHVVSPNSKAFKIKLRTCGSKVSLLCRLDRWPSPCAEHNSYIILVFHFLGNFGS